MKLINSTANQVDRRADRGASQDPPKQHLQRRRQPWWELEMDEEIALYFWGYFHFIWFGFPLSACKPQAVLMGDAAPEREVWFSSTISAWFWFTHQNFYCIGQAGLLDGWFAKKRPCRMADLAKISEQIHQQIQQTYKKHEHNLLAVNHQLRFNLRMSIN